MSTAHAAKTKTARHSRATIETAMKSKTAPPASDPLIHARETARLLKLAADPTRIRLLTTLVEGEWSVSALCSKLGVINKPALSHHLALIRAAQLVETRRDGKFHLYALTPAGRSLAESISRIGA